MTSSTPAPKRAGILSGAARKAQVSALLAVLTAVVSYLVAHEGNWTWQGTLIALLSGVVTGLGVYATTNAGTTYQGSSSV